MPANVSSFDVTLCDVTPEAIPSTRVLTIDELARETGLTVRNVRSHHARGLLPPPEVRGRTGFYGPEHVERLRLIQRAAGRGAQARGHQAPARRLRRAAARAQARRRARRPRRPRSSPRRSSASGCGSTESDDPRKLIAKAHQARHPAPLGDGHVRGPEPGAARRRRGGGRARRQRSRTRSTMIESVERHSRAVSQASSCKLFMDDVLEAVRRRRHARGALGRARRSRSSTSRPLAAQALLAVFRRTMDEEVEATFADLARRLAAKR